jgi:hypothetical protein
MSLVTESPVLTMTCVSTGVARHRVTCVNDLSRGSVLVESEFALATKRKYGLAQRATVGACCENRRDTIVGVHLSAGVYSQPKNK